MTLTQGRKYTLAVMGLLLIPVMVFIPFGDELTKQVGIGAISTILAIYFPSNAWAKKNTNELDTNQSL